MPTPISKILIIENELPIVHALELKLNRSGFSTQIALNGEEALKCLDHDKYDLILLDLIMPKMDGFSFLTELRKKNTTSEVIILSNLSQEEDVKRAKDLGAKNYFVKSDTPIVKIVDYTKKTLGVKPTPTPEPAASPASIKKLKF